MPTIDKIRAGALLFGAVAFFVICGRPPSYSGFGTTVVRGLLVDTSGSPIVGADVYAVHLRAGHLPLFKFEGAPPGYDTVVHQDHFATGSDGRYSGTLPYEDRSRKDWSDYVYYFACAKGFRSQRLYLPERGVVVLQRSDQTESEAVGLDRISAGWPVARKAVRCEE